MSLREIWDYVKSHYADREALDVDLLRFRKQERGQSLLFFLDPEDIGGYFAILPVFRQDPARDGHSPTAMDWHCRRRESWRLSGDTQEFLQWLAERGVRTVVACCELESARVPVRWLIDYRVGDSFVHHSGGIGQFGKAGLQTLIIPGQIQSGRVFRVGEPSHWERSKEEEVTV